MTNPAGSRTVFMIPSAAFVVAGLTVFSSLPTDVRADGSGTCPGWLDVSTVGPSPRSNMILAYDGTRDVVVLFGGVEASSGQKVGDTWEYDGSTWTLRATTGPTARQDSAAAFDAVRGVVVLHGGHDNNDAALGDTWEWDGTAWAQVATSGPTDRWSARMVYDGIRQECVLFGGIWDTGGSGEEEWLYNDTWVWDGTSWQQRVVEGPCARRSHGMAFDDTRQVAVLFGGYGGEFGQGFENLGDTWEWDGTQWLERTVAGPSERRHMTMAYSTDFGGTLLVGGVYGWPDATYFNDTWMWDGMQWSQLQPLGDPLPALAGARLVSHNLLNAGTLYGGSNGEDQFDDTWRLWAVSCSDCDANGYVDLTDLSTFVACFEGPENPVGDPCACADLDVDGDSDLADFAVFQMDFDGP
ncbi:MAG: hypothetical protein KAV82_07645 [Phycisphaerae bacterium]|nr:hypothetical protein [Phycisphaerae bacterium]